MKPCESGKSRKLEDEASRGIRRAQEVVGRYIPRDRSLVDELISERRAEALRERLDIEEKP